MKRGSKVLGLGAPPCGQKPRAVTETRTNASPTPGPSKSPPSCTSPPGLRRRPLSTGSGHRRAGSLRQLPEWTRRRWGSRPRAAGGAHGLVHHLARPRLRGHRTCTCRSHRRLLENYDAGLQPAAPQIRDPHRSNERRKSRIRTSENRAFRQRSHRWRRGSKLPVMFPPEMDDATVARLAKATFTLFAVRYGLKFLSFVYKLFFRPGMNLNKKYGGWAIVTVRSSSTRETTTQAPSPRPPMTLTPRRVSTSTCLPRRFDCAASFRVARTGLARPSARSSRRRGSPCC